jgi:hypothetical protein
MDREDSGYAAPTADPSTSLRFGRDDKGESGYLPGGWRLGWTELGAATLRRLQIPPLRYAPVGMTRGERLLFGRVAIRIDGVSSDVPLNSLSFLSIRVANLTRSNRSPLVIPTGAQRSGGICSCCVPRFA